MANWRECQSKDARLRAWKNNSQQLPPAPCAYTELLETPPQQQNSCVDVFARRPRDIWLCSRRVNFRNCVLFDWAILIKCVWNSYIKMFIMTGIYAYKSKSICGGVAKVVHFCCMCGEAAENFWEQLTEKIENIWAFFEKVENKLRTTAKKKMRTVLKRFEHAWKSSI